MDPLEHIRYEDLNEDGRLVWDVLGREATLELIEAVGGGRIYLQAPHKLRARVRRRLAREMLAEGLTPDEVRRRLRARVSRL
ncbi:hypothetical protein GQ464_008835 [Rhodocaloribacter litoris]|uniref:hypothetical protein n=1 Tax=Rhodocaloribacter litoris TaxID=2558931 RepID=UPI0014246BB4|nr:hypothetical protein [Rhodocaloribacter litoris]QXD17020.1 hypothetical protein GQ464_008835 [Rhodocaloribacter litoris]